MDKTVETIADMLKEIKELKERVAKLEWINKIEGACRKAAREKKECGPR